MYLPENTNTQCGVYMIRNNRNGKKYVGSTKNAAYREKTHFRELKKGVHHCEHLQRAWNKETDKSVFQFFMFIYCKPELRVSLEQGCIDSMQPEYNQNKIAGLPPIKKGADNWMFNNGKQSFFYGRTPWNKGLPKEEQPHYGKKASSKTIEKLRNSHLGIPAWNKDIPLSKSHKEALSVAKSGKSIPSRSLLVESQVIEILASTEPTRILAARFGVRDQVVADVRRNKTWRHIPREKIWTPKELRALGWTPEKRAEQAKHGSLTNFQNMSHETRSNASKKREANLTPERKRDRALKGVAGRARKKLALLAEAQKSSDWPSEDNTAGRATASPDGKFL